MSDSIRAQLYLALDTADAAQLERLLTLNPACVRLSVADESAVTVAETCRALCHGQDIPLVIAGPEETAIAVARMAQADGVHLTGAPKAAPWARRELDEDIIVGIDPGPSRHDSLMAAESGADYVSLSPDWGDENGVPEEITWWAAMIETPMVVENAGTPERAALLRDVAEFVLAGPDNADAVAKALEEAE